MCIYSKKKMKKFDIHDFLIFFIKKPNSTKYNFYKISKYMNLNCNTFNNLCTSSFDSFCVHHIMQTPISSS